MRAVTEYAAKDGTRTWRVRYRIGAKQTSETFRRKQDAYTFAKLLEASDVTTALEWLGKSDQADGLTFAPFFEHYVDQLTGVTPRTRNDYRSLHRRYLTGLDRLPLPLVTRGHITDLVNTMESAGRSPRTIKDTVALLSTCLALAIDEGHITANPCRRVRIPKQQHHADETDLFLTPDEFHTLLAAFPDCWKPLVVFLVGTGMRWSEATAVQGKHVDLANGTIRVRQAWKRYPGGFELGPPKTPKARRTVNPALPALAAAEASMARATDFVFRTRSGGVVRHANFYNNVWKPAVDQSGLQPRPKIKDLRHTHASWLISAGISLEAVQDQLGHESILTTRGIYGHLLPALGVAVGKAASEALAAALSGGPKAIES